VKSGVTNHSIVGNNDPNNRNKKRHIQIMSKISPLILTSLLSIIITTTTSFTYYSHVRFHHPPQQTQTFSSSPLYATQPPTSKEDIEEDSKRQWDLFLKHHAKGQWRGTWTTYDYMGDEVDSTLASVILQPNADGTSITHAHEIITDIQKADCNTCFDSSQAQTLPLGTYTYDATTHTSNLSQRKIRCASVGMCTGPSLLRSGAMSTELILQHGDSRLRVIYMHGPAWEKGVEPGSCPPMGLKVFRCIVSKESLASSRPFPGPTREQELDNPPNEGNAQFFRPVPPFQWHAEWEGSSWTYGKSKGDQGWSIEQMEEGDAWHGRPTGDNENVWNLRLGGGILLQCPRMITGEEVGICRLAWLPEGERGPTNLGTLLRLEAGITALEPMVMEEDQNEMVGFFPPSLVSLRCDTLRKTGELKGASLLDRDKITP